MPHDGTGGVRRISTHAPRTGSDPTTKLPIPRLYDFNPRSPHGERLMRSLISADLRKFQPTLPARGATRGRRGIPPRPRHFNPRSPHGERRRADSYIICTIKFQPTLPARGATVRVALFAPLVRISTHAPRTGSDHPRDATHLHQHHISTHAPRTGSDTAQHPDSPAEGTFQPTLPARGATGEAAARNRAACAISTHAPRTGSDTQSAPKISPRCPFQPTLPARGATSLPPSESAQCVSISTHAPRTGSDVSFPGVMPFLIYFNPRSPHGERRCGAAHRRVPQNFNPRSPHGERRLPAPLAALGRAISTHAPRTGSDDGGEVFRTGDDGFQPTLPARGATDGLSPGTGGHHISTHAPRTGSDGDVIS